MGKNSFLLKMDKIKRRHVEFSVLTFHQQVNGGYNIKIH